mgnify:CR=1 FL=1
MINNIKAREYTAKIEHAKGDPENRLGYDGMCAKFRSLACSVFDDAHMDAIIAAVDRIAELAGLDIGKTDDREKLSLGLKAMRLLGHKVTAPSTEKPSRGVIGRIALSVLRAFSNVSGSSAFSTIASSWRPERARVLGTSDKGERTAFAPNRPDMNTSDPS